MEEWKDIEGFKDYQVSSLGRVKSLKWDKERILSPSLDKDGYLKVLLCIPVGDFNKRVNRLVCKAFHGSPPNKDSKALHKDADKSNNIPDNLYWGTHQDNMNDLKQDPTHFNQCIKAFGKLNWDIVNQIRSRRNEVHTHLAKEFGITQAHVGKIVRNLMWKDPNYVK